VAAGIFWLTADDPGYEARALLAMGNYEKYDDLIRQASARYGVPPELIKAVVWRESRFQPAKVGAQGERGLMQIMEPAAADWAKSEKVETFVPTDLFDPKVNIEVGTWYLQRALSHWASKDDAMPFALAEYNAGRTRVHRWIKDSGRGETAAADDLKAAMDFPGTKSYVAGVMARHDYYRKHGEFSAAPPGAPPTP
jgi:soluble lytic murein transglycosylase